HGSPLEKEDITAIKEKMQIRDIPFTISQITMDDFQMFIRKRCKNLTEKFEKKVEGLEEEDKNALLSFIHGEKTFDIKDVVYEAPEDRVESTRVTSGKILSSVVPMFP